MTASTWTSEGQRLLCAVDASAAEIGRAIGADRRTVSAWRTGSKRPSAVAQEALAAAYPAIRIEAWDAPPTDPAAPPPVEAPSTGPAELAGALAGALAGLRDRLPAELVTATMLRALEAHPAALEAVAVALAPLQAAAALLPPAPSQSPSPPPLQPPRPHPTIDDDLDDLDPGEMGEPIDPYGGR